MGKTILITGFEPFGRFRTNPTQSLMSHIERTAYGTPDCAVVARTLCVEYERSEAQLNELLKDHAPDIVLSFGLALRRETLSIERLAVNIDDNRNVTDNAGARRNGIPIQQDGPPEFGSTLPVERIKENVMASGVSAEISNSAGTFICNHVFYFLRYTASRMEKPFINGFFHVPPLTRDVPEDAQIPGCEFSDLVKAFEAVLETVSFL